LPSLEGSPRVLENGLMKKIFGLEVTNKGRCKIAVYAMKA
jgi:hypothetical protein